MSNKKQTAVEWLFAHLVPYLDWSNSEDRYRFRKLEQEAISMEKEQIVEAYASDRYPCSEDDAEQYYNETYKGGSQ